VRTDQLSLVFSALADPTRRDLLSRLTEGPTTVGELAAPFAMSGPAISQHLNVLERAGLIERRARAQWRMVSIRPERLDAVAAWVEHHCREWDDRLDRLEARIDTLGGGPDHGRVPTSSGDDG
jgi:DNA-binding transcriptional ArsR family regulator